MREYRSEGGFSISDLARLFGVSATTARSVIRGETYKAAGGPVERETNFWHRSFIRLLLTPVKERLYCDGRGREG